MELLGLRPKWYFYFVDLAGCRRPMYYVTPESILEGVDWLEYSWDIEKLGLEHTLLDYLEMEKITGGRIVITDKSPEQSTLAVIFNFPQAHEGTCIRNSYYVTVNFKKPNEYLDDLEFEYDDHAYFFNEIESFNFKESVCYDKVKKRFCDTQLPQKTMDNIMNKEKTCEFFQRTFKLFGKFTKPK